MSMVLQVLCSELNSVQQFSVTNCLFVRQQAR